MSRKIALMSAVIGIACGFAAIQAEHTEVNQACVNAWISDIQADQAAAQRPNHELPFQNGAQFQQAYPAHLTNCPQPDPSQNFVNGSIVALLFGLFSYFAMLIVAKASKALS